MAKDRWMKIDPGGVVVASKEERKSMSSRIREGGSIAGTDRNCRHRNWQKKKKKKRMKMKMKMKMKHVTCMV